MFSNRLTRALALLALVLATGGRAFGEADTGTIAGSVRNGPGEALPGARRRGRPSRPSATGRGRFAAWRWRPVPTVWRRG
jgi:hypothetical protein